jgi:Flp pilus assembly protein TadD
MAAFLQKNAPNSPHGFLLEGEIQAAQQDFGRSLAAFQKAESLESNAYTRIKVHEVQTLLQKAAPEAPLLDWLAKHPDDIGLRFYLADLYGRTGRHKDAIAHYDHILRLDAKDFRALNNMAWSLIHMNDPKSVEVAEKVFQMRPNDGVTADTFGWALVSQGKLYEGVQIMFKAVSLAPENTEVRMHLIQALVKAGDTARARAELKTLLSSRKPFPQAEEARSMLARLGGG